MRLPNFEQAVIDQVKLQEYILSSSHPLGRFKAALFRKMGYTRDIWEQLAIDIRKQHLPLDVEKSEKTNYGEKYTIAGLITGPNGTTMLLKSVWIILKGESIPRFITIYPGG